MVQIRKGKPRARARPYGTEIAIVCACTFRSQIEALLHLSYYSLRGLGGARPYLKETSTSS